MRSCQQVRGKPLAPHRAPASAIVVSGTRRESREAQQKHVAVGTVNDVVNIKELANEYSLFLVENKVVEGGINESQSPEAYVFQR